MAFLARVNIYSFCNDAHDMYIQIPFKVQAPWTCTLNVYIDVVGGSDLPPLTITCYSRTRVLPLI